MKVTFYTNAMLLLESTETSILADPWVTFDNTSLSGFYNFPKCGLSKDEVAAIRPDYIYISHTHPDHLDPPTLTLFDRSTPILVADYEHNFTGRAISRLGFTDVRPVPLNDGMKLNGNDHVWLEPAGHTEDVDSIGLFRMGGEFAINANDNSFHEAQCVRLKERAGRIDVALLPSGAHGPWPMFFENLDANEKGRAAGQRALNLKYTFVRYIDALDPKLVIPIAGGVICGGDKARQYGYSGIRARSEVVEHAHRNAKPSFESVLVSEGNIYDTATGKRVGDYVEQTYDTESTYIEELASLPGIFSPTGVFHIDPSQRIDLTRLLLLARANQRKWQEIKKTTSDIAFYFDVGEEMLYRLALGDDTVTRVKESEIPDERYEIFRMPYELLVGLLTRHYVWSNVNTQNMQFYRHAPEMDRDLMLVLNFLQI
ncbi:MAG TPA: MBL fold metallo-hydrolase [Methyloceanibacter sp.]|nr:MBL fold metallo-hydrolase [Methyloceanibacter sp.]